MINGEVNWVKRTINVQVVLTDGYETRFTEAACAALRRKNENKGSIGNLVSVHGGSYGLWGATDRDNQGRTLWN